MLQTVVNVSGRLSSLAALLAGPWALPTVHLFINDVDPGPECVIGDFVEATFGGYTATPMGAWLEARITAAGVAEALAPLIQWDWDSGVSETVYGVFVKSAGAGTPLLGYSRFDAAIPMNDTADSLAIVPRLSYAGSDAGAFITAE